MVLILYIYNCFTINIMRYFKVFVMVFVMVFVACKKDIVEKEQQIELKKNDNKTITKEQLDSLNVLEYVLSNAAKQTVANWQKFQQLSTQTDFLKKGDLSFFEGNDSLPRTFINELKTTIPQNINTKIIKARLVALETKLLKLNSELERNNVTRKEVLKCIEEYLQSYSNLNLAINKKLELDANNIPKP